MRQCYQRGCLRRTRRTSGPDCWHFSVLEMTPKNPGEGALQAAELVLTTFTEEPK